MPENSMRISVKGIVIEDGKVWLRKNERDEWELPGGKIDTGEEPEPALIRELNEELGFRVSIKKIVSADIYNISHPKSLDKTVFIVSYLCELQAKVGDFEHIGEAGASEFRAFPLAEVDQLNMPAFYKQAISQAAGNT